MKNLEDLERIYLVQSTDQKEIQTKEKLQPELLTNI